MGFKAFLIGTLIVVLGIVVFAAYEVRRAGLEAVAERERLKPDSECAAQLQHAIQLVAEKDRGTGALYRVTDSATHYNHPLHACFVEVTTYDHQDSAIFVKTLVRPAENSAVLWSVTGRIDNPGRHCFGADSMPLDCQTADRLWKTFMSE